MRKRPAKEGKSTTTSWNSGSLEPTEKKSAVDPRTAIHKKGDRALERRGHDLRGGRFKRGRDSSGLELDGARGK